MNDFQGRIKRADITVSGRKKNNIFWGKIITLFVGKSRWLWLGFSVTFALQLPAWNDINSNHVNFLKASCCYIICFNLLFSPHLQHLWNCYVSRKQRGREVQRLPSYRAFPLTVSGRKGFDSKQIKFLIFKSQLYCMSGSHSPSRNCKPTLQCCNY